MEAITLTESKRLTELEETIQKGLTNSYNALREIQEKRLYRSEYETFEQYCKAKWGTSRRRAYQLIDASKVIENVNQGSHLDVVPSNERQTRPLTALPQNQQPEAWKKAVEKADGKQPTAKQVEEAVEEVKEQSDTSKSRNSYRPEKGLEIATLAIAQLKKISPKDTQRKQAAEKVIAFCQGML